ncbi:four helix bundle suffix domain-containing protein [Patescibacteria group bacterium]|nr:four helix bundle suffix domain-containing protein [Patescibacteria group bacterium]
MYEKSYKKLLTYRQAEEIYDLTVEFCKRYIDRRSRTCDQMVQAGRSGKQNIAEGASQGTSLKSYIKLLGVSRGSFEELLEDYKDFSRQNKIPLIKRGDEMVEKVKQLSIEEKFQFLFQPSLPSSLCLSYLVDLITRTNYLLDRQIASLEKKFIEEGGYTENLFKRRVKKRFFTLLSLFTFLSFFTFSASPAYADDLSLGIYPPIIEINATPPAEVKARITIQNQAETDEKLKIILKPFTASSKYNGEVSYSSSQFSSSDPLLLQKVQILDAGQETKEITLAPLESKNLELRASIGKDDPLGDYYFSVIFLSERESDLKTNIVKLPSGIATNVLLSVGPKGPTTGEIEEFRTPFFFDSGPVPFTIFVKNTSEHFTTPTGTIVIKNMFGQTIGKIDLLPQTILANSYRYLVDREQASPSAALVAKLDAVKAKQKGTPSNVALWQENYLLGYYTAELSLSLSENGPVLHSATHFIAIPFSILGGLVFAIMICLSVYLRVRRRVI